MSENGFTPMGADPRWMARHQRKGVRGELMKRLAELIKNADDAYDRLELKDEKTSGVIEVCYDMIKTRGGYSAKGFLVRDFGSGMSREKATQAYYGNNYGSDTSDETRNGAIGVGGKDCFYDMDNCYVITIHDGSLTVIEIRTLETGVLGSKIMPDDESHIAFEFVNKLLSKGNLEEMSLSKNQTIATFQVPDDVSGARPDKIAEQLRQFYTLRWILESKIRKVKLTDLTNAKTVLLKHAPIPGESIFEKTYEIVFNQKPYEVTIQFSKYDDGELPYGHNAEQGYGILIQSGRGAILDNQMYGFENDPGAAKIFGKIIFNDWKQLYRESNGEILTNNREGLDYVHPANAILKNHILTNLKPIIESERQKHAENPQLDKKLDQNIKKAFDIMNKLLKKKPNTAPPQEFVTPPDSLEFESESIVLVEKKVRRIKLYLNPGKIPTCSEISLSLYGDGVTINPESIITAPPSYDTNLDGVIDSEDEVPFVDIEITAKELVDGNETQTTLKAVFGEYEAETEIHVKNETSIYPKNGFAFIPKKITVMPKKERKIKLLIDTNLIATGTSITLDCNDDRINFKPKTLTVSGPPNVGQYLTEEVITISGSKIGIKAKLTAETETKTTQLMGQATREIRTAVCEIQIKEKEPPKTFFKDYKLCNECDKRVRSSFVPDEGRIYIHVNAPILKHIFGRIVAGTPKNIHEKKPDALTLLADTVVERMTFELAKHLVHTGEVDVLGEPVDAIQGLKGELEYDYGLPLLQTIIQGFASHNNSE